MKKVYIALGLVIGLWAIAQAQENKIQAPALDPKYPDGTQLGRFQLFQAEAYSGQQTKQVLRIDTTTGEVCALEKVPFIHGKGPNPTMQIWMSIQEEGFLKTVDEIEKQVQEERTLQKSKPDKIPNSNLPGNIRLK
jgi:hypothetical protein